MKVIVYHIGARDYYSVGEFFSKRNILLCLITDYWKNNKNYTTKFEQIELKTHLGHGFIYKPLKVWIEPSRKWILTQKL